MRDRELLEMVVGRDFMDSLEVLVNLEIIDQRIFGDGQSMLQMYSVTTSDDTVFEEFIKSIIDQFHDERVVDISKFFRDLYKQYDLYGGMIYEQKDTIKSLFAYVSRPR